MISCSWVGAANEDCLPHRGPHSGRMGGWGSCVVRRWCSIGWWLLTCRYQPAQGHVLSIKATMVKMETTCVWRCDTAHSCVTLCQHLHHSEQEFDLEVQVHYMGLGPGQVVGHRKVVEVHHKVLMVVHHIVQHLQNRQHNYSMCNGLSTADC